MKRRRTPACAWSVVALLLGPVAAVAADPAAKGHDAPGTPVLQGPPPGAAKSAAEDAVVDRLELDATAITGNRELPKVMSIVPWKSAEPPAGPDRPMGTLIEGVLTPVDRDEFRREITYYRGLTSQSTTAGAQAAGAPAAAVTNEQARRGRSGPPGASIP